MCLMGDSFPNGWPYYKSCELLSEFLLHMDEAPNSPHSTESLQVCFLGGDSLSPLADAGGGHQLGD